MSLTFQQLFRRTVVWTLRYYGAPSCSYCNTCSHLWNSLVLSSGFIPSPSLSIYLNKCSMTYMIWLEKIENSAAGSWSFQWSVFVMTTRPIGSGDMSCLLALASVLPFSILPGVWWDVGDGCSSLPYIFTLCASCVLFQQHIACHAPPPPATPPSVAFVAQACLLACAISISFCLPPPPLPGNEAITLAPLL